MNPRDELLDRAVAWFAEHGIGDTSMRTLAAELGTSGRMLHYHFGSREGLLVAIRNRLNESVAGTLDQWTEPRELWAHFAGPQAWPVERLFFELYAQALFRRPGTEGLIEASVHRWIDGLARELVKLGVKEGQARIQARVHLAIARGLLLDLLATEQIEEVDQAYEYYLELVGHRTAVSTHKRQRSPMSKKAKLS